MSDQQPSTDQNNSIVEQAHQKIIGNNYLVLKSLKNDPIGDVYKCFYLKGLVNFGKCVVKQAIKPGIKDEWGRTKVDKLNWERELYSTLYKKIPIPKLIDFFETNDSVYLVMEFINGKSIVDFWFDHRTEFHDAFLNGTALALELLDYIHQSFTIISQLHNLGYVHRDATPSNFLVDKKGKVFLIDFELCYSIHLGHPNPPFVVGSPGYMSKEQQKLSAPTFKEDIYALGGLLLRLIPGIDPLKIEDVPYSVIKERIEFFVQDELLAQHIINCLNPEPEQRPTIHTLLSLIEAYIEDLKNKKTRRVLPQSNNFSKQQLIDTAIAGLNSICSPLMTDENGWFSDKQNGLFQGDPTLQKYYLPFVYTGAAGPLYTLSLGKILGLPVPEVSSTLENTIKLFEEKLYLDTKPIEPGLYFGRDGIALSIAIAGHSGYTTQMNRLIPLVSDLCGRENPHINMLEGIAGQGMAILQCQHYMQQPILENHLQQYASYFINTQLKNGSWAALKYGGKFVVSGFAQGMAGIIYFLLSYGEKTNNADAVSTAQRGLEWLIASAKKRKNALYWKTVEKSDISRWWGEGSPGIALTFIKAYHLLKDITYKNQAIGALQSHRPYTPYRILCQSHGLCGLGAIYLEAYRAFQEEEWYNKAGYIAQMIMHLVKTTTNNNSYWTVGLEVHPTADFMTGNSGIVHFLMHYCFHEQLRFPFIEPTPLLLPPSSLEQNSYDIYQNGNSIIRE